MSSLSMTVSDLLIFKTNEYVIRKRTNNAAMHHEEANAYIGNVTLGNKIHKILQHLVDQIDMKN